MFRHRQGVPSPLRSSTLLNGGIGLIFSGLGAALLSASTGDTWAPVGAGVFAWMLATYNGAFHMHITRDEFRLVPIVMSASAGSAALVAGLDLIVSSDPGGMATGVVVLAAWTALSLAVGVFTGRGVLQMLWKRGQFRSTVIVAGAGRVSSELGIELRHRPELGIDVVAEVLIADPQDAASAVCVEELEAALRRFRPDRLILGEVPSDDVHVLSIVRFAGTIGTRVYVLPRFFSMGIGNPLFSPDRLRGFPLQRVNRPSHPNLALALKRLMDLVVSASVLIVVSPFLAAVAVLVKVSSPGPLLFWQERLGRNGETIRIPKIRSMRSSETSDFEWTAEERVTRVGGFLRRSAIDEVPQLWSVLRGDMSLVGPRPERPAFATQFAKQHVEYQSRLRMRSGLTGLAQIAGLRGDTSIPERAKYDNLYIDQWSLTGDVMILIRTVGAIVGERRRSQTQLDFEAALSTLDLAHLDEPSTVEIDARASSGGERNVVDLWSKEVRSANV